ncbi:hypothetical protein C1701_25460 [Actinoalloteichus sp. AHMU CJ021]|uniref:DUF1648 domain-containing protein n=1 Tax=Actinoalloteichus TaxID=65496 RepID=UPI000318EDD9|nr:DUF5808 domain-containing protein [Actinoalloteichus spitiensis]AUS81134.1 hypothetical protein C1701_25460 [Actinoalloteichus sp. AHMU CJ021]
MFTNLLEQIGVPLALGAVLLVAPTPILSRKTVPFSVRVPPDRVDDPVIVEQRRLYRNRLSAVVLVVVISSMALGQVVDPRIVYGLTGVALLMATGVVWHQASRAITTAKRRDGWYEGRRQGVAADTTLRTDPVPFPWLWTSPALAVLLATTVVGVLTYPTLPDTLVMPASGGVDATTEVGTSALTAFALVLLQAAQTGLVLGLTAGILRSRGDIDPAQPDTSARRYRRYLTQTSRGLVLVLAALNLVLGGLSWVMWTGRHDQTTVVLLVTVAPALLAVAVVGFLLVRVGPAGSRVAVPDQPEEDSGLVQRDDDRFWRGDMMYSNREDPAILVPRRMGFGWTFNLANPITRILFGTAILGTLVLMAFGVITPEWR